MSNNKYTKRDIIESILATWERCPNLRLGQLICNAINTTDRYELDNKLFYIKDHELAGLLEEYDLAIIINDFIIKHKNEDNQIIKMNIDEIAYLILHSLKEYNAEGRFDHDQIVKVFRKKHPSW